MHRKRMHVEFFSVLVGIAATAAPVFAADAIPTYPNATNNLQGAPANSGMMQLTTPDAADKVDAWYGTHLPRTCKHETAKGGAKYACPGTNIMVTPNGGKTLITQMAGSIGGH